MSALVPHVPSALVDRLAKIAGMLGSDHDGERSAAAYRATALIREAGLTWAEVIKAAGPRVVEREPERSGRTGTGAPGWYGRVNMCLARTYPGMALHGRVTEWERKFLWSLADRGPSRRPSAKQLEILAEIYSKVMST